MIDLPRGSWDTHCHVFSPDKYPYITNTPYTPPPHSVDQLIKDSPCDNHVIVMAVPEGTDCGSMLDAIQRHREIKGDARGVAVLSTEQLKDAETCRSLYKAGVRSVRLHEARIRMKLGKKDLKTQDLIAAFTETAQLIDNAKVNWSIEAQLDLEIWAGLTSTLRDLHKCYGTIFVVDHTFSMTPHQEHAPDFDPVLQLLSEGPLWVKLSGMSRFSPDFKLLEPILRRIISTRPDRVVFGSDAPHVLTGGETHFADVDVEAHLALLRDICADRPGSWEGLMRDNAEALYQR